MGSSFFGLNIATSGLFLAKAGLEVTSNNVANMTLTGYSRQHVEQVVSSPLNKYSGVGQVGTGTTIRTIGQTRDTYLDLKYWPKVSKLGESTQKYAQLSMMETSFNALSDTSMTGTINSFFTSVSELTFSAESLDYRTSVINSAQTMLTQLQNNAATLVDQQIDINNELYAITERINSIGAQIANINQQIYQYEIDGHQALDLRDERVRLLDELSSYVNVSTKEYSDGTGRELGTKMQILINGQEFVNHDYSASLTCERRDDLLNPNDAPNLYDITWSNGKEFYTTGMTGQLKGLLDVRDGDGTGDNYQGIPYYIEKMNEFVRTMAYAMNTGLRFGDDGQLDGVIGHQDGYNLYGENEDLLFFSMIDSVTGDTVGSDVLNNKDAYYEMTIFNVAIGDEIREDPSRLAVSSTDNADDESNNEVMLGFLNLKDDITLFSEGGAYQFANALASTLALNTSNADSSMNFYEEITGAVDFQRMQVYAVSLNEEIANMVMYQHLYQVASKLISVMSDIYETTINGLGL